MVTALPKLAAELDTTDRTLRRAVHEGLIRGRRLSPRRFDLPIAERCYLRENWGVLSELRAALRTEPSVRAAVLFGSYARGDHHSGSDIDLLVDADRRKLRALRGRLERRVRAPVQLVALQDAENAPLLLAEVIRDGRVLVDRCDFWRRLLRERARIIRAADDERRRIDHDFLAAFGDTTA